MHSGDAVPLKPLGTKMSEALVEMTSKGFGCVGIVDAADTSPASSPTAICAATWGPI